MRVTIEDGPPVAREASASKRAFTSSDALLVGTALGVDWNTVSVEQFRRGLEVELEHGTHDPSTDVTHDDLLKTGRIAWAHLKEDPEYYTKLAQIEAGGSGGCPHHVHPPEVPTIPVTDCAHENPAPSALPVHCEPFLRVTKDVEKFKVCAAKAAEIGELRTAASIHKLVGAWMQEQDQEHFVVVLMDVKFNLRGIVQTAVGQRSGVGVGVDDILSAVAETHAERLVVVHNHPSGDPTPSPQDRELTKTIRAGLAGLENVVVCDHVIIGLESYFSEEEWEITCLTPAAEKRLAKLKKKLAASRKRR